MEPELPSPESQIIETTQNNNSGLFHYIFIILAVFALCVLLVIAYFSKAPNSFQKDTLITVYSGREG
jgi:hypothetical protein